MEDLVLNEEQALHLQELGIDMSDAKLCWYNLCDVHKDYNSNDKWVAETINKVWKLCKNPKNYKGADVIPTYTLQEILEKLPNKIRFNNRTYLLGIHYEGQGYEISYSNATEWLESLEDDDFLTVAYDMLCWVIKHGHLKPNKDEEQL